MIPEGLWNKSFIESLYLATGMYYKNFLVLIVYIDAFTNEGFFLFLENWPELADF